MVQANVQQGILGLIRSYRLYNRISCSNGHLLGARSASESSMKVTAGTIMVVASVASGSQVVGDVRVAIRAAAGVSSRGTVTVMVRVGVLQPAP
jgi:predicted Zn-dependent peptidase